MVKSWIVVFFLFSCLFPSFCFGIQLKKSAEGLISIDLNHDGKTDYQVMQKITDRGDRLITDIFYQTPEGKKINITSERDDKLFLSEFKHLSRGKWSLYKRVRITKESSRFQKKIIQTILTDGRVREQVYVLSPVQLFDELTPIVPNAVDGNFRDGSLIQDRIMKASKDCLTLEIISQGLVVNVDELLNSIKGENFLWSDYVDFEGCGDACSPGQEKISCTGNPNSLSCPMVVSDILFAGLQDKLVCLAENNHELAAQAMGVLFNDKKKMKIECNRDLGGSYASARNNCGSEFPRIRVSKIHCRSSMLFNVEALNGAFLHELIHTTGQSHGEHPDYAYACHAACMDTEKDSLSRFYGQPNSAGAMELKQAAQTICRNQLGPDEGEAYIKNFRLVADNVGSLTIMNNYLSRSLTGGGQFATDPLQLFEDFWRDSEYHKQKKQLNDRKSWTPPEGEWHFCQKKAGDEDAPENACADPDGHFRGVFFNKIISDKSMSQMMINMLMFSENSKNLRADFVKYLGYTDRSPYMTEAPLKYNGALKDVMMISDLKRIGASIRRGDIRSALLELQKIKTTKMRNLISDTGDLAHQAFYKNFIYGVKTHMKRLCVEHMEKIKDNAYYLEICRDALAN